MKTRVALKKRVALYFSLCLVAGVAALHGVAEAAVMPAYERLSPLTAKLEKPTDVAVDQQGNAYVAETVNNHVIVISQSGRFLARLNVAKPISLAVDNNGNLLVGSDNDGSVSMFGPDLSYLSKLGTFGKPMDIAVDSAGKIYVVDKDNSAITIYNSSHQQIGTLGAPGNGDGQLHHPVSIAIDENADELVVLDHKQVLDSNTGTMIDGARIQYFNKTDGSFIRGYSKFGKNNAGMSWDPVKGMYTKYDITMGQLTRPNQVAVDALSRVYVTDAYLQKVMVYDNFDAFLGTIDSETSPLRIPLGIAMGDSGRLYVASLRTKQVEVYGIDSYTSMFTTPPVVEFQMMINGAVPPAKPVTITNLGKADINWTSSTPDAWVSLGGTAGTVQPTDTGAIDVTVDPSGFAAGTYTGSVTIDTGAGSMENIKVLLTVASNPLQVSPGSLDFETSVGTTAPGLDLNVTDASGGGLLWEATADQPWIVLSASTGVTDSTTRVYVDTSSLATGSHSGTVTFTNKSGDPAPVEIPVSLTLNPATGDTGTPPGDNNGKNKWQKKWTVTQVLSGTGTALNGVSGTAKDDAIVVGDNGTIFHFDGKNWTQAASGTAVALNSVASISQTSAYAVGEEGQALQFNGTDWQSAASGGNALMDIWGTADSGIFTADAFGSLLDGSFVPAVDCGMALRSISGTAADDVIAAGEAGSVCRYDGGNAATEKAADKWLNGIWANAADDVFAVGENGTIAHFDGTNWTPMTSGVTANLNGVCGTSGNDVYAVGDSSLVLRFDGSGWTAMDAGVKVDLNDIWCSGQGDLIIVGDDGTIIQANGGKFPWDKVIVGIAARAALQNKERKEKEKE